MESFTQALWAQRFGANQIELCGRLDLDGLTPSPALIQAIHRHLDIPIKVMIRPHHNSFVYTAHDKEVMLQQINRSVDCGTRHIVTGGLTPHGVLDLEWIEEVCDKFNGLLITVHKAIDLCSDPVETTSALCHFPQVRSVLSSGGTASAVDGIAILREMMTKAGDRLDIIAAGSVRFDNVSALHEQLSARIYHGRRIVPGLLL